MKRRASRRPGTGARRQPRLGISEWLAMAAVLVVGIFLVAVGVPGGWYAPTARPEGAAGGAGSQETAAIRIVPEPATSPVVRAWRIQVSERATGRPAGDVEVTLYADHKEMRGAHPIGPMALEPTGRPGEFRGQIGPLMYGTWLIEVRVSGSVSASRQWEEPVQAGGTGDGP